MSLEILVFEVDDATLAVPISNVREVLRAAALFPLPDRPRLVEGGLNLRGEIIPVVDGRAVLSRTSKPITPSDHLIVLSVDNEFVAIRVDRAVELAADDSDNPDDSGDDSKTDGQLIDRVVNTACGPTAILNVEQLLTASSPKAAPLSASGGSDV